MAMVMQLNFVLFIFLRAEQKFCSLKKNVPVHIFIIIFLFKNLVQILKAMIFIAALEYRQKRTWNAR